MFAPDAVVALGLSSGECPVGMVKRCDGEWVTLVLFNWAIGIFSGAKRTYRISLVAAYQTASELDDRDKKRQGYSTDQVVFDMDPLGDFQTRWEQHGESG